MGRTRKHEGKQKQTVFVRVKGPSKPLGGSKSEAWNQTIADQAINSLWLKNADDGTRERLAQATVYALIGIEPRDEIEGMLAAQMLACHNAAMECYRRAMIGEQTFVGRSEALNQANKLSRTHATLG